MVREAAAGEHEFDVVIVGGGMVGASLAAGMIGSGRRLMLVESTPFGHNLQPSFDERTTALGNASRRIFEGLGVWTALAAEAAAIRGSHVSGAGPFGSSRLTPTEQGIEGFRYVIANRPIGAARWEGAATAEGLIL